MTIFAKKDRLKKYFKYLRMVLFLLLFFVLSWLFYKNFAPLGKLVLYNNFNKKEIPFFIVKKNLENPEKNIDSNISYSRVLGNPAEFSLQLPRKFEGVEIELKYIGNYPLVYMSSKKKNSKAYISKILEFGLSGENWKRIEDKEKGLVLFQQYRAIAQKDSNEKTDNQNDDEEENNNIENIEVKLKPSFDYNRVQYFLNDLDNIVDRKDKKIAYFNYDLSDKSKIFDYAKASEKITFDKTIRGKHEIVAYLGENENLDFNFYYQDMNRYSGPDRFNVFINKGDETIARYTEKDDGDETSSKKPSSLKNIHIEKKDLKPGKYTISLDISDDLYIHKIETGQKYFVFQNHLSLIDPKQSVIFYTDAKSLNISTLHNEGLEQNILAERQIQYDQLELEAKAKNSKDIKKDNIKSQLDLIKNNLENEISIDKRNSIYELLTPGAVNKISISKNDILINYGGLISTDPETIYNLSKLEEFVYPLQNGFDYNSADYVITEYFTEPKIEGPFKIAKQKFNLDELEIDKDNKVNFSINLHGYNRNIGDLKIAGIKFTLEKDPWNLDFFINKIKEVLK